MEASSLLIKQLVAPLKPVKGSIYHLPGYLLPYFKGFLYRIF